MKHSDFKYTSFIWLILLFWGCNKTSEKEQKKFDKEDDITILSALPLDVPCPTNNPITESKVELGKYLFYDPILSGNKDVACATCHLPEFSYSENLEISIGVGGVGAGSNRNFPSIGDIPFVKRNSQSVLNVAFNGISNNHSLNSSQTPMFWDLRVKSLELQALEPIKNFEEMRGHSYQEDEALKVVLNRLKAIPKYQNLFEKAVVPLI